MQMGHSIGDTSERNVADEVSRFIEQSKELQELATSLISRTSKEEASLRQRTVALRSNIKMLRSFIDSSVKNANLDPNNAPKMVEELS
ncbi:hypothetical protein L6452_20513 [Arctium lappa]|uniref:Uncharacterized protein n=1 Tax=Arctium lappa TaxID=4217 RepID=A0ACB9BCV6_ARCLA|nr:hypothetical protein L6452_20513 [Arctium lappa]